MSGMQADLLLTGGHFWTLDDHKPWAEALAIRDSRIVFVGTDSEVLTYRGHRTRVMRLKGRFGIPGFNDAHVHWSPTLIKDAPRYGITTLQLIIEVEQIGLIDTLRARGGVPVRISFRPPIDIVHAEEKSLKQLIVSADSMFRCGGVKGCVDGMMGNSTALLFAPYTNGRGNRGLCRQDMAKRGSFENLVRLAVRKGYTPSIHAIGDKANRLLLDLYERVISSERITDHRFRMVHAQMVHPDDVKRFGDLGLVVEVNPVHVSLDLPWIEERIGHKRSRGVYAFRSLQDAGALLCFGSDYPGPNMFQPYFLNPLLGLYGAVTRCTLTGFPKGGWFPEECLSLEDAIRAYTLGPALASGEQRDKGSLQAGKLADIVILSENPFDIGPSRLTEVSVVHTIVGGRVVYSTPSSQGRGSS